MLALLLSLSWVAFGQDRKVTGSVQDAKGGGIPGVSVAVKGTTTGTTTDVNGAFTISVKSANAELQVTSVGYVSQTVALAGRSSVTITLQDDVSQLNEVIVTGYASQRKKDIT